VAVRWPINRREPEPPSVHFFAKLVCVGTDPITGIAVAASSIQSDLVTDVLIKRQESLVLHLGKIHGLPRKSLAKRGLLNRVQFCAKAFLLQNAPTSKGGAIFKLHYTLIVAIPALVIAALFVADRV
jgi:hypothetical protein